MTERLSASSTLWKARSSVPGGLVGRTVLSVQRARAQSLGRELRARKAEQPRRKKTAVTATAFCLLQVPTKSLAMMDAWMSVLTRPFTMQPFPVLDTQCSQWGTPRSAGCPWDAACKCTSLAAGHHGSIRERPDRPHVDIPMVGAKARVLSCFSVSQTTSVLASCRALF